MNHENMRKYKMYNSLHTIPLHNNISSSQPPYTSPRLLKSIQNLLLLHFFISFQAHGLGGQRISN